MKKNIKKQTSTDQELQMKYREALEWANEQYIKANELFKKAKQEEAKAKETARLMEEARTMSEKIENLSTAEIYQRRLKLMQEKKEIPICELCPHSLGCNIGAGDIRIIEFCCDKYKFFKNQRNIAREAEIEKIAGPNFVEPSLLLPKPSSQLN